MAPGGRNYVVEYRPDTTRTAGGGWVRDSYGQWWALVDHCSCEGTASRCGVLSRDIDGKQFVSETC